MSRRLAWLLGTVVLVAVAALIACGNNYSSSSDGLVLVGSQGSAVVETFSFDLANGHIAEISNSPPDTGSSTCLLPGLPSSMVLDPAGQYAYVVLNQTDACSGSKTGIVSFKVNSDGTIGTMGSLTADPNPVALAMDAAGKFLFVAEGLTGQVNSYTISNGSLTAVPGTYTFINGTGFQPPNFAALASTPTVFPPNGITGIQNAPCSDVGNNPPTSEYLYAVDTVNYVVWEFSVNTSTGALQNPGSWSQVQFKTTGAVPSGVAVDPCDRFAYVSNYNDNTVSAYTICNGLATQSQNPQDPCPATQDGTLRQVSGSPFSLSGSGQGPGPLLVHPFGTYLYVLDQKSNMISPFSISPTSGSLQAQTVVATGLQPTSMAVRGDGQWLFVTDFNAANLSQYSIIPSSGALSPLPAIQTDNYPWGVAVK
jgi:6-phosphogluconolactonase (cycloisomerase 2 family)